MTIALHSSQITKASAHCKTLAGHPAGHPLPGEHGTDAQRHADNLQQIVRALTAEANGNEPDEAPVLHGASKHLWDAAAKSRSEEPWTRADRAASQHHADQLKGLIVKDDTDGDDVPEMVTARWTPAAWPVPGRHWQYSASGSTACCPRRAWSGWPPN
jgi:hypothetical protein